MHKRKKSKTKNVQTKNCTDEEKQRRKYARRKNALRKRRDKKKQRTNAQRENAYEKMPHEICATKKWLDIKRTTTPGPVLSCPRPSSIQDADNAPMLIQLGFWGTGRKSGQSPWSFIEIALGTVNILWTVDHLEQGLGNGKAILTHKTAQYKSLNISSQ